MLTIAEIEGNGELSWVGIPLTKLPPMPQF
jgi:hypothetical protein